MIKTFEEVKEVDSLVGILYSNNPKLENTKFGYTYSKFFKKNIKPTFDKIREEISDIRIQNALEDKNTKEIIIDKNNDRGYKFTKDGLKSVMDGERKILDKYEKQEIEIEPYFSNYIPEELEEWQTEILKGLIIE